MTFVVVAVWTALPGQGPRIRELIAEMTPLSRAEPGNLGYEAHVDLDDPDTFLLYERYVDAQAYEDHKGTPHFQRLVLGQALVYLRDRRVTTYEPLGE
ncbi:putative quinol monooxygenase [Blastococcus sp. SYSU DS0617]